MALKLPGWLHDWLPGELREQCRDMLDAEDEIVEANIFVGSVRARLDLDNRVRYTGADIAVSSMQLPGHGTCAIVVHGGIDCGLWQR